MSDLNTNLITAWNQMLVTNDFLNPDTGLADPKPIFGTSNFDVFRWPRVPLIYYGEEQNFYLYDSTVSNYLSLRPSSYDEQQGLSTLMGCDDDWNSLDHFDPTTDMRRLLKHFLYPGTTYNAIQDGFELVQLGNWTYLVEFPGSNSTATELGLWSRITCSHQRLEHDTMSAHIKKVSSLHSLREYIVTKTEHYKYQKKAAACVASRDGTELPFTSPHCNSLIVRLGDTCRKAAACAASRDGTELPFTSPHCNSLIVHLGDACLQ
ncbi:hypothetical protein BDR06DRAFT_1010035 [Suillus hirtellus]|nr:hypothetical protein BDR06DRAFT_1010035 [Suillus hirtellus]